jgi:hypothetical protein
VGTYRSILAPQEQGVADRFLVRNRNRGALSSGGRVYLSLPRVVISRARMAGRRRVATSGPRIGIVPCGSHCIHGLTVFCSDASLGFGGGDVLPLARVIGDTMAVALGFPMRPEFRWVALFFGCTLIASSLVIIARLV